MSAEYNEAPVIGGVTAVQEEYNENPYAIKVTVSNIQDPDQGDTIKSFSFTVNDGDPIVVEYANMIDNGDGSYSHYIELTPEDVGEFTVSAVVTDSYDKPSASVSAAALVIEDVTPPDMVDLGMGLEDQKLVISQVGQTVTFTWDVPYDNVGVVGYNVWFDGNNGGAFTVYTNSCSTSDLEVGYWHSITIEAFDAAGNVGQEGATKYPIQVHDYTVPTKGAVDLSQVQDGYQVTVNLADWSDNVAITAFSFLLDGDEVELEDLGEGVYALYLTDEDSGEHEITVTAYDEEGNSTVEVTPFTVADVTAPVAGTLALEQAENSQVVTATLEGWLDNVGITSFQFYVGADEIDASKVTKVSDTEYQLDMTEFGLGEFSVTAEASDAAGNTTSSEETPIALEDRAAPVIGEVHFVQTGFNAVATFSGLSDNVGVEGLSFTINETEIEYEEQANGSYLLYLGEEYVGENTVVIRAMDAAENETSIEAVLTIGDDEYDDWGDMGDLGPEGTVGNIGVLSEETQYENAVGTDDPKDYMAFTLDNAANLIFTVQSTNAIKFSINKLVAPTKQGGKYTLKSLQSTTLKAGQTLDTKALLLNLENGEPTTYYIGVEAADKNAKGAYSLSTAKSTFFTNGDNSDDWTDLKANGAESEEYGDLGVINSETEGVIVEDWVGFGDAVDYKAFTLESAASIAFDLDAGDAAKLDVWTVSGTAGKYTLKSLANIAGKLDKNTGRYTGTTKATLLQAGTYYIGVQSTNAAKGGNADYTVALNDKSAFFVNGYNGDDWTDVKANGAESEEYGNIGVINNETEGVIVEDWVGFGDAVDYKAFTLENAASIAFDLNAGDAAKLDVWTVSGTAGKYTLKSLANVAGKLDKTTGRYTGTTKAVMLQAGTYYIGVQSTNAAKGGNADYTVALNDKSAFFVNGYNGDDWTDVKANGAESEEYGNIGVINNETEGVIVEDWVGFGDAVDYKAFTLENAASIAFDLNAGDAAKLDVWTVSGTAGKYTLKSLANVAGKLDKNTGRYTGSTKAVMLQAGTYYLGVQSTNAAKGGNADYTVALNDKSAFFVNGDNSDDWTDLKANGAESEEYGNIGVINAETEGVIVDAEWVGFGDAVDYKAFTLESAASIAFDLNAGDAAKLDVWTVSGTAGKYSLKSLVNVAGKLDKTTGRYTGSTKATLLQAGTYYIGVQSTNAAKGGNADYTVALNNKSAFFVNGDNNDDWTDLKANGTESEEYGELGVINAETEGMIVEDWVGFGDAVDYKAFTLESAASIVFDLDAGDAAKLDVWTVSGTAGKYTLKSLANVAGKLDKTTGRYTGSNKAVLLEAGTYYLGVQSTNAAKGGNADYTVTMNGSSVFFTKGDNSDDWGDVKANGAAGAVGKVEAPVMAGVTLVNDGWVGYGDSVDYMEFTLAGASNNLQFDLTSTDAAKFTVYQLQGSAGKYSLKSLQSTTLKANVAATTKALKLAAGTYYLAMEATNAKKGGSADYMVKVNEKTAINSMELVEGDNEGTANADAVLVSGNKEVGQLTMLAGNDQVLLGNDATLSFALIDMGEGNDVVNAGAGASLVAIDAGNIAFGDGDDSLVFSGAALDTNIDMGAGNDTVTLNLAEDLGEFDRSLTLGEGDDAVSISGGHGVMFASIDFGAGNDTLNLGADTTLVVTGAFDVEGLGALEMADGATLVLNDEASFNAANEKFGGMNIVIA